MLNDTALSPTASITCRLDEANGAATNLSGVEVDDPDSVILGLEGKLQTGIDRA